MTSAATDAFRAKAPAIMAQLCADFDLTRDEAAAILGNLGHECAGFTKLQEMKPTVKGSRGGWGWAQWTGPRRRAFEAYCSRNGLANSSDKANYAFLFLELKGSERGAIAAVKKPAALRDKVIAFELAFLRAGAKHYDSRIIWARLAQTAYASIQPAAAPMPRGEAIAILTEEADAESARGNQKVVISGAAGTGGTGVAATAATQAHQLGDWLLLGSFGAILLGAAVLISLQVVRHYRDAKALKLEAETL